LTKIATVVGREPQPQAPLGTVASLGVQNEVPTSVIRSRDVTRIVMMLTAAGRCSLKEQLTELLPKMQQVLDGQEWPLIITSQTIFLADATDEPICAEFFAASTLHREALLHYVIQPPAEGARWAVELWAIGGPGVSVVRQSARAVAVTFDAIRWLQVGDVNHQVQPGQVHATALQMFQASEQLLAATGMDWSHVVRTWWYLSDITGGADGQQRYAELNRARADYFTGIDFNHSQTPQTILKPCYPASTGIGMASGGGLVLALLALQTDRADVQLLPLENPLQTPAYDYGQQYSPRSPRFSRAMALVTPEQITIWISGTASIVRSEACHLDDIVAQTEQTLDNIAALISPENFHRHGCAAGGATLKDLAKIRVYVKRPADVAACRAVCERRLGAIPALYLIADVCRPELLVEIEGVTFSRRTPTVKAS
jgi:enamine deaminase RidA (YjgF/YER057c/UK114 family)